MIISILLIAHLMGDFVLQTSRMALGKRERFGALIKHSAVYAACMLVLLLLSLDIAKVWLPFATITVVHFLIDWVRMKAYGALSEKYKELYLFIIDQVLHIGSIFAVIVLFELNLAVGSVLASTVQAHSAQTVGHVLMGVLVYGIVLQPAAVVVKKALNCLNKEEDKAESRHHGYTIGILERIIVVTLILVGQLPTIGFVLAAKSIARFKQFDEQDFAETYLVGTLLSVAIAIGCAVYLKWYWGL